MNFIYKLFDTDSSGQLTVDRAISEPDDTWGGGCEFFLKKVCFGNFRKNNLLGYARKTSLLWW